MLCRFYLNFGSLYTCVWPCCGCLVPIPLLWLHLSPQRWRSRRMSKIYLLNQFHHEFFDFDFGIGFLELLANSKFNLTKKTVYLSDIEMENISWVWCCWIMLLPYFVFFRLPTLKKCQVFSKKLVDPLLEETYRKLLKLPRYVLYVAICILLIIFSFSMADFSSTWGPRSEQGGYRLSHVKSLYKSPDMKWVINFFVFFFFVSALMVD